MAVAGPVFAGLSLLNGITKDVRDMVKADRDLQADLDSALLQIECELGFLRNDMNKEMSESNEGHGEPQKWILQLHDLVYDMQDFMADRSRDRKTSAPVRLLKAAGFQGDPRREHVKRVEGFKEKIKQIIAEANKARPSPSPPTPPPPPPTPAKIIVAPPTGRLGYAPPVGMVQQKEEIIELLLAAGGHEGERKVISIVGCAGVGKTTLAKALCYDPRVQGQFLCAWVPAPQSSDQVHSVLESLQRSRCHGNQRRRNRQHCHRAQEVADAAGDERLQQLQRALQEVFGNKRYLVVVDGVQKTKVLDTILSVLPENNEGSRVVVTTSICSVAKGIRPGGYLYTMRRLGSAETADLFWRTLNLKDPSPAVEDGLKTFFNKCDGLPLVVVGASKLLRRHGAALNEEHCQEVGTALGNHLAGTDEDPDFAEARSALARYYWHSLPRYEQKMCMFSLSSFPKDEDGHGGIKTNSLLRRWVAEGLVAPANGKSVDEVACKYWDKLLDLGVLEPVSVSRMGRNNRCQVHGVTLEYLVHHSVTWNSIALVKEGRPMQRDGAAGCCSIRRVAIHGGGEEGDIDRAAEELGLSSVRSLTVRKASTVPASLLERCRMLRVLDLEGCDRLGSGSDNHVVRLICKLLHLRYLSLRSTKVAEIPTDIEHLHSLETLDVRDTDVGKLPMEVLMLPQLAHLFGRFELPAELEADHKKKLEDFFKKKSKLVTLAGFKIIVNSKRRGHELILRHARNLKKVKVWCELPPAASATIPPKPKGVFAALRFRRMCRDAPRPRNAYKKVDAVSSPPNGTPSILDGLVSSLDESRFIGSKALHSLSVDFPDGHCIHFLDCVLKDPCAVRSIKVRGRMEYLPNFQVLMKLREIKELHLCNTWLGTNKLSVLQSMQCLEYLKLTEDTTQGFGDGSFDVNAGGFPSLQHLCFHGPRLPELKFTQGSMKALLSLQLICLVPAGNDLGVKGVENLPCLDEVILHPNASDHKMEAWRAETLNHSCRPNVKKQQQSNHTADK